MCVKKLPKRHPNKEFGTASIRQATGFELMDGDELSKVKFGFPKSLEVTNESDNESIRKSLLI